MQASRMDSDETAALPPFPEGWYFVASAGAGRRTGDVTMHHPGIPAGGA